MPPTDNSLMLEIIEESRMTPDLDASVREILAECFPASAEKFSGRRAWYLLPPLFSVVYCRDEEVVAHAAIVPRLLSPSDACSGLQSDGVTTASIHGVSVGPQHRGLGLSRQLLRTAVAEARHRGFDFGILFCQPELEGFYNDLGWRRAPHKVVILDREGVVASPMTSRSFPMYIELASRPFPDSPLFMRRGDERS
jgi:GNAT superfamily N-acetyltransferase